MKVSIGLLVVVCTLEDSLAWAPITTSTPSALSTRLSTASLSTSRLMAAIPTIEDWKITKNGEVIGVAKNHPAEEIDDGDTVTTSRLANPGAAAPRKVVSTESGSKYRLGKPLQEAVVQKKPPARNGKVAPAKATAAKAAEVKKTVSMAEIKKKYKLTGEKVGNYMLAGKPQRSTSGKSQIWTAYKVDSNDMPVGEAVKVKISTNKEKMLGESRTYRKVSGGKFVKCLDFYPQASTSFKLSGSSALVLESGGENLKEYLVAKRSGLQGRVLRDAAVSVAQCIQAFHGKKLVWTDLKPENFVVFESGKDIIVKGIDLESAMPVRDNPIDYSPEACPPEFARALRDGEGPYFILDFSYDIWSYGILLYEIATGESAYKSLTQNQITKALSIEGYEIDVSAVPDPKLRDLVAQCLRIDPKKRPSMGQVLLHPYFLTTGIGPISF